MIIDSGHQVVTLRMEPMPAGLVEPVRVVVEHRGVDLQVVSRVEARLGIDDLRRMLVWCHRSLQEYDEAIEDQERAGREARARAKAIAAAESRRDAGVAEGGES